MIITNMAVVDLGVRRRSLIDVLRGVFRHVHQKRDQATVPSWSEWPQPGEVPALMLVPRADDSTVSEATPAEQDAYRWRRHPQLLGDAAAPLLSNGERRARRAAVNALFAANQGDIDDAFAYFLQAVSEHQIDLTETPSFWQMPRAAILAAADAYDVVGRYREAAAIAARVRTELRPRNVVPLRPASEEMPRRRSVGGD